MSTFLYVEDDPINQQVMELLLIHDLGHTLILFEDSVGFMEKLKDLSSVPNVIFLDIHIEPLDGFEIHKVIRQHPDYCTIPVIAVTASVDNKEVQLLKDAGFNGIIAKPIDPDTFPDLMARILQGEEVWDIP